MEMGDLRVGADYTGRVESTKSSFPDIHRETASVQNDGTCVVSSLAVSPRCSAKDSPITLDRTFLNQFSNEKT